MPQPPFFPVFAALLGLILGSFATCVVHRYLSGQSLLSPPRSFCPACGKPIRARDNIPLLGYLLLRGRCRDCGAAIPLRYPLIEAILGAWGLALALTFGPGPAFLVHLAFGWMLVTASAIDLDCYLLPDVFTLPAAVLSLPCAVLFLGLSWRESLLGMAVGGGLFFALQLLWRGLRGQEGLGGGDVKLMLSIGGLLGPAALPPVISVAAFTGLAASLAYVRKGKGLQTRVPFGPFLALGAMLYILFGRTFWAWYLGR